MKRFGPFLAVAVAGVLLGAGGVVEFDHVTDTPASSSADHSLAAANPPIDPASLTSASSVSIADDFSALYEAVRPSVVEIDITGQGGRRFRQFQGQGSGVVLDTNGDILTNEHVVSGAQSIVVTFSDGVTASADVVGTDSADDLAVIKTSADQSELHPATLGDSSALKIGNVVVAVGNPFGLGGSFTTGVLSGIDRTLEGTAQSEQGLLQTDAAINEGSSGGGLFNTRGELVGVTSALENPDASTFAGVGYAVPINVAKQVMQQLLGG
jgi:S1-C subfamily serine protease